MASVTPPSRTIGISSEAGLIAYWISKAALSLSLAVESSLAAVTPSATSAVASAVLEAISPGVTIWPWASITRAPAGTGSEAPTPVILPPETSTVPEAISPAGPRL